MALSIDDQKSLLILARNTIYERLTGELQPEVKGQSPELNEQRATFVTLKKTGALRGCIGCLSPYETLRKNVVSNALNAAFHDRRFSPLTLDELTETQIGISILSESQELQYEDADDLLKLLRPDIDGVVLRHSGKSGTFLPQVWEQLPTPETFLSHLCLKAGLPQDVWKNE